MEIRAEADDTIEVGQVIAVIGLVDGVSTGSPMSTTSADIGSAALSITTQLTKEQIAAMKPEELSAQLTPSAAAVVATEYLERGLMDNFPSPLVRSIARRKVLVFRS